MDITKAVISNPPPEHNANCHRFLGISDQVSFHSPCFKAQQSPLSRWDASPDPQRVPEPTGSTDSYIDYVFSYIYIKFNLEIRYNKRLRAITKTSFRGSLAAVSP